MQSRSFIPVALFASLWGCENREEVAQPDAGPPPLESWTSVSAPAVNYYSVHGSSATDVWIVGAGGTILHWDGMALNPVPSGTKADLYSVYAVSPMSAYAVG